MKLILAVKKDNFIYDGSRFAPSFGHPNFYYNALILNCVYNCDYCYLQGMYSSGNIVIFVNGEEYFTAAEEIIKKQGSIYLCISYDTDLLAFENIIPNCRRWIEWVEMHPEATIEVRTKSTNFSAISELTPNPRVVLAWTLSPAEIINRYEAKTPSLDARLQSVKEAIDGGWTVRICIDPILYVTNWENFYKNMIGQISETIPLDAVFDFSIGVFRMSTDYLENIRKMRKDSDILYYPFLESNGSATYSSEHRTNIVDFVKDTLIKYSPSSAVQAFS